MDLLGLIAKKVMLWDFVVNAFAQCWDGNFFNYFICRILDVYCRRIARQNMRWVCLDVCFMKKTSVELKLSARKHCIRMKDRTNKL